MKRKRKRIDKEVSENERKWNEKGMRGKKKNDE